MPHRDRKTEDTKIFHIREEPTSNGKVIRTYYFRQENAPRNEEKLPENVEKWELYKAPDDVETDIQEMEEDDNMEDSDSDEEDDGEEDRDGACSGNPKWDVLETRQFLDISEDKVVNQECQYVSNSRHYGRTELNTSKSPNSAVYEAVPKQFRNPSHTTKWNETTNSKTHPLSRTSQPAPRDALRNTRPYMRHTAPPIETKNVEQEYLIVTSPDLTTQKPVNSEKSVCLATLAPTELNSHKAISSPNMIHDNHPDMILPSDCVNAPHESYDPPIIQGKRPDPLEYGYVDPTPRRPPLSGRSASRSMTTSSALTRSSNRSYYFCSLCTKLVPCSEPTVCRKLPCAATESCGNIFHCHLDMIMHMPVVHPYEFRKFRMCHLCQGFFPQEIMHFISINNRHFRVCERCGASREYKRSNSMSTSRRKPTSNAGRALPKREHSNSMEDFDTNAFNEHLSITNYRNMAPEQGPPVHMCRQMPYCNCQWHPIISPHGL